MERSKRLTDSNGDSDSDSDVPLMLKRVKRPVDSGDGSGKGSDEPQEKKPKTAPQELLTNNFRWMDAIHFSTKRKMQEIADEFQGQVDELERKLAIKKEEAGLAYTANVALGALTAKYDDLTKAQNALKGELAIAKEQKRQVDFENLKYSTIEKQHELLKGEYSTLEEQYIDSQKQVGNFRERLKSAKAVSDAWKAKCDRKDAIEAALEALQEEHETLLTKCAAIEQELASAKVRSRGRQFGRARHFGDHPSAAQYAKVELPTLLKELSDMRSAAVKPSSMPEDSKL
ncbi:hypothetical protein F5882DRAFT_458931 [Hyaloscypha sp. PMI_1271]|nr:hypothetical protein F5882DRAFT_458931 [Hyaloscypha sp. PMI_1271]